MKQFNFRLQKVLEYREMQEQWARDAYLDCRTSRLEAEFASIEIGQRRNHALVESIGSLRKLEEKASEQEIVVNVLLNEEQKALAHWTQAKIELDLLKKMRDQEYADWERDANHSLKRELEEWALWKRAA